MKPIRRVVTGNDANGESTVTWDGPSPYSHPASMGHGRGHTDLWVWTTSPAPLSGTSPRNLKVETLGDVLGEDHGVLRPADVGAEVDELAHRVAARFKALEQQRAVEDVRGHLEGHGLARPDARREPLGRFDRVAYAHAESPHRAGARYRRRSRRRAVRANVPVPFGNRFG